MRTISTVILMVLDALVINLSYLFALWIRFDCSFKRIPDAYLSGWGRAIPVYTVFTIVVYWFCRMYKSLWRYASYNEVRHIIRSSIVSNVFYIIENFAKKLH